MFYLSSIKDDFKIISEDDVFFQLTFFSEFSYIETKV